MTDIPRTCPACGLDEFKTRRLVARFSVTTCSGCGLRLLMSPGAPDQSVEPEFARINKAEYTRGVTAIRRRQAAEVISLVKRHRPRGHDWLDVGCSFGVLLSEVKREGFSVFGVEPDRTAFDHARGLLGGKAVYHGSMTSDTRPDESADVISMLDVLEHIPAARLRDFARLIHRKLRPGGFWLIKVPSTDGLYFKLAEVASLFAPAWAARVIKRLWQLDYEFPHAVYFNEGALRRYLERHGFQPVEVMYIQEVPSETVCDRLRIDDTIPRWQAQILAPSLHVINWIERRRERSDAMVVLARRVETG